MPAVVLEAGIAASSVSWSLVQPEIARFTRVCSYDRAGLAWSEYTAVPRTMGALVSELRSLLRHAAIPPPYILVGHSFGGVIIRAFARAHPQEVAGLVFVDTLHPEEWCEPSSQQRQLLRGGVFLSRVGAVLARLGIVRVMPVVAQRWRSRRAAPIQPHLRPDRRGASRAHRRRSAKAPAGGSSVGAGALVEPASVSRDEATSVGAARVLRRSCRRHGCVRRHTGRGSFVRQTRRSMARRGCRAGAHVFERKPRNLLAKRPLGAPRRPGRSLCAPFAKWWTRFAPGELIIQSRAWKCALRPSRP